MNLKEFLECKHDIDIDSSMTRLTCQKCYQDLNIINYVEKLEADNKVLRECVEFYANRENWDCWNEHFDSIPEIDNEELPCNCSSEICEGFTNKYAGKKARQALATTNKGK